MSQENTGAVAPEAASSEAPETNTAPVTESSTEESGEEILPDIPAVASEPPRTKKSYELKVNGKNKTIDFDSSNDEEVKSYLQKALASEEKFQEASTYRKQAEQLVERLQTDPLSILRNPALGIDIKKLAEQVLLQDMEEQNKSPEQKKLEAAEQRLKEYEEKQKSLEDQNRQAQLEEATKRNYQEVEESMMKALETSDLPGEPYFVRRVADIWAAAVESGWEDAKLEDIMPYVQERVMGDLKGLINKNKEPDKLEKLFGKDVLTEYRKSKISKMKKAPMSAANSAQSTAKTDTPAAPAKKYKITDIAGW